MAAVAAMTTMAKPSTVAGSLKRGRSRRGTARRGNFRRPIWESEPLCNAYTLRPLAGQNGLATRFILCRTAPAPGCCSTDSVKMDASLKMNEWIGVIMEDGKGVPVNSLIPVTAYGTLEVGEELVRDRVISLYRMKGEDGYLPPEL